MRAALRSCVRCVKLASQSDYISLMNHKMLSPCIHILGGDYLDGLPISCENGLGLSMYVCVFLFLFL